MPTTSQQPQIKPIAVMSNAITKSSYNLSVTEHKILKTFVSQIKYTTELNSDTPYYPDVKEFAELWGLHAFNVRKEIELYGKTLFDRYIYQEDGQGSYRFSRWISDFAYNKPLDRFEIYWSPKVIQHLCLLRERFVKIDLSELIDLQSSYSFRLYEILTTVVGENSYKNPYFTVTQLMDMFDVPESYREYKVFNNRVLKTAVGELKTKVKRFSKMEIEEEKEKGKRKVVGVRFCGVGVSAKYKTKW
jgi:hypothetical protein